MSWIFSQAQDWNAYTCTCTLYTGCMVQYMLVYVHTQPLISMKQSGIWEAQIGTLITIWISPPRLKQGDESEYIKGLVQEKCLSSRVIVVSKVKTAVNSNDAWNQPLWIPPVCRKKTEAHERGRVQDNSECISQFKQERKKELTKQHIKCIPYLSPGSSVSAHWLQREQVLNWRLIAVPSFLSITISFSCGLTIIESNVIAQPHTQVPTVFIPPFRQCQSCPVVGGIKTGTTGGMSD